MKALEDVLLQGTSSVFFNISVFHRFGIKFVKKIKITVKHPHFIQNKRKDPLFIFGSFLLIALGFKDKENRLESSEAMP
jgi:hypothetical protein